MLRKIKKYIQDNIDSLIVGMYLSVAMRRGISIKTEDISKSLFYLKQLILFDEKYINELTWIGDSNIDGSYPVPTSMVSQIKWIISPGVGHTSVFEEYFLKLGCKVAMLDEQRFFPHSLAHKYESQLMYIPKYLGIYDLENEIQLNSIFPNKTEHGCLQIDIEGGEWQILGLQENNLDRFDVILIELHGLHELLNPSLISQRLSALGKLFASHKVLWSQPNRITFWIRYKGIRFPDVIEVLLIKRDLL